MDRRDSCAEGVVKPPTDGAESVSVRRLKKREVDRRCQRKARAKTQAHIQYLETLVETLRQQDASGRVTAVHAQLQRTEDERARLARTLNEIQRLLSNNDGQPGGAEKHSSISAESHAASSTRRHPGPYQWIKPARSCCCKAHVLRQPGHGAVWQGNYWKFIADVLDERFDWRDDVQPADDDEADDILIRAVLEGWDAVAERVALHPSLQMMRRVDESSFGPIPPTERLAMMRAMHLQLQYHTDPCAQRYEKLPPWYTYRPSQHIPHTYAIDYWTWPHFRQRFISNEHVYCGNGFFHMYQEEMRLLWPFEFRDCYTHDLDTGLYKPSRLFDERINDVNCWTMGPDFFEKFPELSGVIPPNMRGVPKAMPAAGAAVTRTSRSPRSSTCVNSARSTGFILPAEDDREDVNHEQQAGTRARPPVVGPVDALGIHHTGSRSLWETGPQDEPLNFTSMPQLWCPPEEADCTVSSQPTLWHNLWHMELPTRDLNAAGELPDQGLCEESTWENVWE